MTGNINGPLDLDIHTFPVTFFQDEYASSLTTKNMTLPGLRDLILETKASTKSALPWLKGARFGGKKKPRRDGRPPTCLRWDENVTKIDMIELDYDAEVISFDEMAATLKAMKVRSCLTTSPSHTDQKPRMRVLMPTSGPLPPDMRAKLCARVNGRCGRVFASESFTLSQSYYFGRAQDNPAPNHRAEIFDGRFIDQCIDDLFRFEAQGYPKAKASKKDRTEEKAKPDADKAKKTFDEDVNFDAYLVTMGDGFSLQGFNGPLTRAAASYAYHHGSGLDREVLKGKLRDAINAAPRKATRKAAEIERYLSDTYLDEVIASAVNKYGEAAKADDVYRLNQTHAVLPIGGKTRVVTFGELEEFPGRETIVMTQTLGDFAALQNKYRHEYVDEKGQTKAVSLGSFWLNSKRRRQYDAGMAFMPQHEAERVHDRLNLWRGYGVKKPAGKSGAAGADKFLEFMLNIICSGDEKHFDYLLKREATIFQRRIRSEIALGLSTEAEGCGKGFYEYTMGHLLGVHAMQVGNPKHVIGAFNPHLETLLRLTADEALFVGNPEHRNALFGLITEPKLTIEPKGCGVYRADSFLNLSVLSNSVHFLPVSGTARRFLIPTVSAARKQDFKYFKAIQDQLNDGGYEALLYHLLYEVDLSDFNVRMVPRTQGLLEQRKHSLAGLEAWWCELLECGTLAGSDPLAPHRAVSNAYQRMVTYDTPFSATAQTRFVNQLGLFDQARLIEPRLKHHTSDHRLADHLTLMGCENGRVLRRRGWVFPPLLTCRAEWEKQYADWQWRDATITAWRPEEDPDDGAEEVEVDTSAPLGARQKANDAADVAAKAQAHAEMLFAAADAEERKAKAQEYSDQFAAERARANAKFR
jgi:Family of unknown function (DUF5906)